MSEEANSSPPPIRSETRLSVVLYGGVSLAIYMNGVCQELLNLVKATRLQHDAQVDDAYTPLRHVYQLLSRIAPADIDGNYRRLIEEAKQDGGEFTAETLRRALEARTQQRRVTIDVLSGASAGGLNAIFLSRALIANGSLDSMANFLVEHGEFLGLLHDEENASRRPGDWPPRQPKSLLDGDRFYMLMIEALRGQRSDGEPLVDVLDCFMSLTDLRGVPKRGAVLADGTTRIDELQHRSTAHLRYGSSDVYGVDRNDFFGSTKAGSPVEPFLAFVGRATAAHPAAFHPAQLKQLADLVPEGDRFDPSDPAWLTMISPNNPTSPLECRWFSDGGALDNKPFTHAIEPVDDRRSEIPIDRQIVFVEPDPGAFSDEWQTATIPKLWSYTAGAFTLPRKEGILDDLRQIDDRNNIAARLNDSVRMAMEKRDRQSPYRVEPQEAEHWAEQSPESTMWWLYELERARSVIEDLTTWILMLSALGLEPLDRAAARTLVQRALEQPEDGSLTQHRRILARHDVRYRLRRLNYVDQVLSDLQSRAEQHEETGVTERQAGIIGDELGSDQMLDAASFDELRNLRRQFNVLYLRALVLDRSLRLEADRRMPSPVRPSRVGVDSDNDLWTQWLTLLDRLRRAESTLTQEVVAEAIQTRQGLLRSLFDDVSDQAAELIDSLPRVGIRDVLQAAWHEFDTVDIHLLPRYSVIRGELSQIGYRRFSPIDATSLRKKEGAVKLGGAAVHHFGGFFDRRWRQNDILWGRLDAAESIVDMMLPGVAQLAADERRVVRELRDQLIASAQESIIRESRAAIEAIVDLSPRGLELRADMTPAGIRQQLASLDLSLSVTKDSKRNRDWLALLSRAPRVIGEVIALSRFDPWNNAMSGDPAPKANGAGADPDARAPMVATNSRVRREHESVAAQRRAERARVVERANQRMNRVGATVNGFLRLVFPTTRIAWFGRHVIFPLMVVAGAWGVVRAYGSDRQWLAVTVAGIVVAGVLMYIARRLDGEARTWRRFGSHGIMVLAVIAAVGSLVAPSFDRGIGESGRAGAYAVQFSASALGLVVVVLFGAVEPARIRNGIGGLLTVTAIATAVGATWVDDRAAVMVVGSLLLGIVGLGAFIGFARLQATIYSSVEPHDATGSADAERAESTRSPHGKTTGR